MEPTITTNEMVQPWVVNAALKLLTGKWSDGTIWEVVYSPIIDVSTSGLNLYVACIRNGMYGRPVFHLSDLPLDVVAKYVEIKHAFDEWLNGEPFTVRP